MGGVKSGPIIHIGYHKTATTWFQDRFYPAARNGAYVPRDIVRRVLIAPKAFAFSPSSAREALTAVAPGKRLLLCEENLSGYLHNGGLGGLLSKEVAIRLKETFPDATIVIFIRSQPRIIQAAYAQYVKGGGTHCIERYLHAQSSVRGAMKHWYKAPLFDWDHFEFGPLLRYYRDIFGPDAIVVKLYEEFVRKPKEFLISLTRELALDVPLDGISLQPVNASLSARQIQILRRLNILTARSVQDKWALCDLEDWYENRWIWLDRIEQWLDRWEAFKRIGPIPISLQLKIEERFRSSNARLARDFNLPLRDFGYPLPDSDCTGENVPSG
jgi:hypothetical protein